MSAASPTTARTLPGENGLRRLTDMVMFKAGRHQNLDGTFQDYSADYVKAVADNFAALRHDDKLHVEPPAVLGHEADQANLKDILSRDEVYKRLMADGAITSGGGPTRTDQPAAGWPENVRFDQATGNLVGDLERIPPTIADMIDTGQLRFPSVEFKEGMVREGKPVGPVLWRLSLLGGTPPRCKTIPPFGQSHFADGVIAFADAGGADPLTADPPPDKPVLTVLGKLRKLSAAFMAKLTKPQVDQLAADTAAELAAAGEPVPGEIAMSDTATMPAKPDVVKPAVSVGLSEADRKLLEDAGKLVAAFADQQKAMDDKAAAIKAAADGAIKAINDRASEDVRKTIKTFCEEQRGVRLTPAMIDAADPRMEHLTVPHFMATLDYKTPVHCFADKDGTEVKKTQLENFMDIIRSWPVRAFGDRMNGAPAVTDARSEQQKQIADFRKRQAVGAK